MRPLRVAIMTTANAPGLPDLLQDPDRGKLFQLVIGLATDPGSPAAREMERAGVPCAVHNLGSFCVQRGARRSDLSVRREFDERTVRFLRSIRPDLVLLDAYLHILTAPMLEAYPDRILNLHDADLTLTRPDGSPRYCGLHATYDALAAGETETRTCVHQVGPEVDRGRVVLRSGPFPVSPLVAAARRLGATRMLKAYAFAHREWMMRTAWGPLLNQAIRMFAGDPPRRASEPPSRQTAEAWSRRAVGF